MKRLCVIGDPVAHSKSPLIQTAMLRALGLEGEYEYSARRVQAGALSDWLETARRAGYVGFNATMPHKEALLSFLDTLSPEAAAGGTVNTVTIRDGALHGHSTDGPGFLRALRDAGFDPQGKVVTLLGAGGAAKAVALALAGAGAGEIAVCNRTPARARALCALLPAGCARAGDDTPEALCERAAVSHLLVNCTSLGMTGSQGFSDLGFLDALPAHAVVCDLIYSPPETALLAHARARGLTAINGMGMLIHQAILALEAFLGRALDHALLYRAALRSLEG